MMDTRSQQRFDEVTSRDPSTLSKEDIGFLRARRAYLRPEQKLVFSDVLEGVPEMTKAQRDKFNKANREAMEEARRKEEEKEKKIIKSQE
jgi:hypothetical protein